MNRLALGLMALALWTTTTMSSHATGVTTLTSLFSYDTGPSDGNIPPYLGVGILQYDGSALPDGTYAWTALDPTLSIDFLGSVLFTQEGLATTAADVDVEIRSGAFFFTNVNEYGDGPVGGAADFYDTTSTYILSTEPGYPGGTCFVDSGATNSPEYEIGTLAGGPIVSGLYGVPVPEPSQWSGLVGLGFLLLVSVRRLRAARA